MGQQSRRAELKYEMTPKRARDREHISQGQNHAH